MSSADYEKTPCNKMYMMLFKYMIGLNEGNKEIELTRPVTNKMMPQRRGGSMDEEMCFWLGSELDKKTPPRAIDRKVTIQERDEMTVFVRWVETTVIIGLLIAIKSLNVFLGNLMDMLSAMRTFKRSMMNLNEICGASFLILRFITQWVMILHL
jgi:hypothetical protein